MNITIKKMHHAQVKMMLDYLGIPIDEQSSSSRASKEQLTIFQKTNREEYQKAYESVVEHKTGSGGISKMIDISDASKIIMEQVRLMEAGALSTISNTAQERIEKREKEFDEHQRRFVAVVDEKFKAAVERESKKFNTMAVKFVNKPAKKIAGVVHHLFPKMCQLAKARKNILLVGPSGCGKSHVAKQLAEACDLRFGSQSCSAGVSESAFAGWLLPIAKDGRFDYVMSTFIDLYENGGLFLFDEMDASDANLMVFLNQALANGRFNLPQRYKEREVIKHKDFVAVGCANTFGGGADSMYHGRIALDAATLDRFRAGTIFMDYSPQIEEKICDAEVLEWGLEIRSAIKTHKLKKLLTTRVMEDCTDMKRMCEWDRNDWDLSYFADWSPEEKAAAGFRGRGEVQNETV